MSADGVKLLGGQKMIGFLKSIIVCREANHKEEDLVKAALAPVRCSYAGSGSFLRLLDDIALTLLKQGKA